MEELEALVVPCDELNVQEKDPEKYEHELKNDKNLISDLMRDIKSLSPKFPGCQVRIKVSPRVVQIFRKKGYEVIVMEDKTQFFWRPCEKKYNIVFEHY